MKCRLSKLPKLLRARDWIWITVASLDDQKLKVAGPLMPNAWQSNCSPFILPDTLHLWLSSKDHIISCMIRSEDPDFSTYGIIRAQNRKGMQEACPLFRTLRICDVSICELLLKYDALNRKSPAIWGMPLHLFDLSSMCGVGLLNKKSGSSSVDPDAMRQDD